jgi:hypothetical protein
MDSSSNKRACWSLQQPFKPRSHQEKIDNIGFGAGPAYLQFDLFELELAQLKLQFGQIRGLAGKELCVD